MVMTDEEIIDLAGEFIDAYCDDDLIAFARAIESRTLNNQKARWYQIGAEAERHDIAKMVENYCGAWDNQGQALVQKIRVRGE
jgi:hypothetical protein